MILTITNVETMTGEYGDYLKVTGEDKDGNEKFKNVGKKFHDKYPILIKGSQVDFKNVKKDGKWVLSDIVAVRLTDPQEPMEPDDYPDKEVLPTAVKSTAQKRDTGKNGAFSLSYAKDVACSCISSGQLKPTESKTFIITLASSFLDWLNGE
uniref:Uncharacterized protein n=1 Tax=viral metagenome TaxID=1070528 RepID=A0A6M3JVP0_9ZZZZ